MTLGDNRETIILDSSDWDILSTGAMTGIGVITSAGDITTMGAYNLALQTSYFSLVKPSD